MMYNSGIETNGHFSELEEYPTEFNETSTAGHVTKKLGGDGKSACVNGFMDRWVVRMRGLPYRATKKEVETFFSDVDVVPVKVCFAQLRDGRASGEVLVEFDSKENLDKAYKKNKENFLEHDRYIEMFDSTPDAMNIVSGAKANVPLEEICDTDTSVIKMRGLPFTAGTPEVNVFLKTKNLEPVRIHHVRDRIGRPAGICYVELATKEEADVALTLDHAYMGSRYVEVSASSHTQLAKDVNQGVMTMENQFAGATSGFGGGRGSFANGGGFRGGRGRGRVGLGYGGRGRGGMGQSSWISTTVGQRSSGGMGGYGSTQPRGRGGYGSAQSRGGGGYRSAPARGRGGYGSGPSQRNPNQGSQQGFDGPQGPWQSGQGYQGRPGYQGGYQGGFGNQGGHQGGSGYQGGFGY